RETRKSRIGARHHDDRVLGIVVDGDERGAAGTVHLGEARHVDAVALQCRAQHRTVGIRPHGAHEGDLGTARATRGDGLIGSLATTGTGERAAQHRLTGTGDAADASDGVLVAAADDDDRHLDPSDRRRVRSASSSMERSAPPGIDVAMLSRSGAVHELSIASAPISAPTTEPTVAPAESVSQPAATANAIADPKSAPCACTAHAMTAALFRVCTQCMPANSACSTSSALSAVI